MRRRGERAKGKDRKKDKGISERSSLRYGWLSEVGRILLNDICSLLQSSVLKIGSINHLVIITKTLLNFGEGKQFHSFTVICRGIHPARTHCPFSDHGTPMVSPWDSTPSGGLGADLAGPTPTCHILALTFSWLPSTTIQPFFAHGTCAVTGRVSCPGAVAKLNIGRRHQDAGEACGFSLPSIGSHLGGGTQKREDYLQATDIDSG